MQGQCLPEAGFGLLEAAQALQRAAQVVVGTGGAWVELQRLLQQRDGFVLTADVVQQHAEVGVGLREIRIAGDGLAETGLGLGRTLHCLQHHAQVVQGIGVARHQLGQFLQGTQCFLDLALLHLGLAHGLPAQKMPGVALRHLQRLGFQRRPVTGAGQGNQFIRRRLRQGHGGNGFLRGDESGLGHAARSWLGGPGSVGRRRLHACSTAA